MKKILLFACFAAFLLPSTIKAQTAKEIVEKYWKGSSVQDANFTKSGKVYLSQSLKLTLNSDNSVTGSGTTKMTLDDITYTCISEISGTFYPSTWQLYIKDGYNTYEDKLPDGLRWCKGNGTLTIYSNSTHPGYYLLKGNLSDDCGGNSDTEFTDYSY